MDTRETLATLIACGLVTACANPCLDDGLGQDACPLPGGQGSADTDTAGADAAGTDSAGDVSAGTGGGSGGMTAAGDDEGTFGTGAQDGDSAGESLWCVDADGDGFGDPGDCQTAIGPVEGSVDNDGDCDDGHAETFPGAAPYDDLEACMRDADGDDWGDEQAGDGVEPGSDCHDENNFIFPGAAEHEEPADLCAKDADDDGYGDDDPPAGVEAGSDCADENPFAFPGAAEHENPPHLCTLDADEDGWGDASPDEDGPVAGSDCYDSNSALNPDKLELSAFLPSGGNVLGPRTIATIDPLTASAVSLVTIEDQVGGNPSVDISSATIDEHGHVYANDIASVQIHTVDYAGACMLGTGEIAAVGAAYGSPGDILCGLEFGSNGSLYGIDNDDNLMTIDPATGQVTSSIPIETMGIPLNINSCGMAYDCAEDRLLVANGINNTIYSINPNNGVAQQVRDLGEDFDDPWNPVGLEYDQVTHRAYISTGTALHYVELDNLSSPVKVNNFEQQVSNLQYLPICP